MDDTAKQPPKCVEPTCDFCGSPDVHPAWLFTYEQGELGAETICAECLHGKLLETDGIYSLHRQ